MARKEVALSVDFEFFTQTPAYRNATGSVEREAIGLEALDFMLEQFRAHDAMSTFYVVSEIAVERPAIVERIVGDGHEIGSHTHTHRLLPQLSKDEQRSEIHRSRGVLEDISGRNVDGFRAPSFARPDGFFELLDDAGYRYDTSVTGARTIPGWYGGRFDITQPATARTLDGAECGDLVELPVSVMPLLRLPLTGTWVRFFGRRYLLNGIRWLLRRDIVPVLYFHPWEFVDLPAVDGVPSRVYVRTGDWMRDTLRRVLDLPVEFLSVGTLASRHTAGRSNE